MQENEHQSKNQIVHRGSFFVLLFLVSLAFIGLITDFLMACFWAAILAIIFDGTFKWMVDKLNGRRDLSALLTTLLIILVVVIPIMLISVAVIDESTQVYEAIESGELQPKKLVEQVEAKVPAIVRTFERLGFEQAELQQRLNSFATNMAQGAGEMALRYTQNAISLLVQFTLMLYLLFFFLRDGRNIVEAIKRALPIGDQVEEQLFHRFAQVSRATLKGTVVVAVLQGSIGGLLFWILGIPGAILWGVLMILLSLLPVGGSAIVWAPTALILIIQGEIVDAVIIIVVGALIIGLIDNLLRPRLVSRETQMPDYVVLLATLGGLAWFGLSGFIIGPVIAALFITCWNLTSNLFRPDETSQ